MGYTFSTDQQSIIDARKQNILVSAAAGSGKTSVLTERIVGLVKEGIDIDRILVVTFTNAAAKEMKERIAASLNSLLEANPTDAHLQKQAQLIFNADITTIDSYCLKLVKNNFHRINVDPAFRVASEGEMKLLKEDVMRDVMKRAYASKDKEFYHLIDCYSKKDDDDSLEESILKLYTYAMSYPWPESWLTKHKKDYEFENFEAFKKSALVTDLIEDVKSRLDKCLSMVSEAKALCEAGNGPYGYQSTVETDEKLILDLISEAKVASHKKIKERFDTVSWARLSPKAGDCDETLKNRFKEIRDRYKSEVTAIKDEAFSFALENAYEDMQKTSRIVATLIDLVLDFMASFEAAKRDRGVIDFTDMEHMAIRILIESYDENTEEYKITDVAQNLREHYYEVMVDEYQDSNLVQEILIQSISREHDDLDRNRFMVGDIKQSIYRFRLARSQIFAGKVSGYTKDPDAPSRLITLKENYRSRDGVINAVNAIFYDVMTLENGGLVYDKDQALNRAGSFTEDTLDNKAEVLLLDIKDLGKDEARQLECEMIAKRIKDAVGSMLVQDKETRKMRPACYGDVAILYRSKRWNDGISEALEKLNIPYQMEGTGKFYDTREIQDVLSFLRIVDNPLDDISLYATMTSVFGRFEDGEIARIKGFDSDRKYYYLWDKLIAYLESTQDEKLSSFIEFVNKYRKYVTYMPIHELIGTLFDETGYKHLVSALPDGKQRLANVNMLIIKASEYAKTSFYGLFHFLRYVELIKKMEQDEGEVSVAGDSNTVKIMTIHKSKGLEFPICILGGVEDSFNQRDLNETFLTDIDEGIGASFIDPEKRIKRTTLKRNAIARKLRFEGLGEEIRILYVALTRAKEKLIIAGSVNDYDAWLLKASSTSAKSYLELIKKTVINKSDIFDIIVKSGSDVETSSISDEVEKHLKRAEFEEEAKLITDEQLDAIKSRLDFKYPHENLERLYTKTTVSELKLAAIEKEDDGAHHVFEENESHEYIPSFAGGDEEVKGTDRGTIYHNLLQLINFSDVCAANESGKDAVEIDYNCQIARIIASGKMSSEDIDNVFPGKMLSFLKSDMAIRMGKADRLGQLFKEQPFVMGVPASEIEDEFPSDETVLIQGVIDVFFVEDDEVVVLDYKTDRVETAEELANRYKKQLDYYAMAIQKLTGKPVKQRVIYSFRLNQSIIL